MKVVTLLTLILSAIVGMSGLSDMTTNGGRLTAIAGLLGVAISSGALAICSAIEALGEKKKPESGHSYASQREERESEASRMLEAEYQQYKRDMLARRK